MDLNLYLGTPLSPRRPRGAAIGSSPALSTPQPEDPPTTVAGVAMSSAAPEPYSPSSLPFLAAAPNPPRSVAGGDPVPGYWPQCPSYQAVSRAPFLSSAPDPPPSVGGGDSVPGYWPRSPSYQTVAVSSISGAALDQPRSVEDGDPVPGYWPRSPSYQTAAVASFTSAPDLPRSVEGGDSVPMYWHQIPSFQTVDVATYGTFAHLSTGGLLGDDSLAGRGDGVGVANGGRAGGSSTFVRYSPSYLPLSAIPEDHVDANSNPYRTTGLGSSDIFEERDESTLLPDFVEPEFRFRRLIELQRRTRDARPSRLPGPYGDDPPNYSVVGEMVSSDELRNSRKNMVAGEGVGDEGLQKKKEEKNSSVVNFECNICLDLAQEPVVTSCGHLFCWPCLYQWLHLHCTHSECPVCKGEVIESGITPIYGRGNQGTSSREARDGDSGIKVPPRPRGRRIESWRQRIRRPISRRFSLGIANTWRRVLSEELHNEEVEASLREMINNAHRRVAPRLRARRTTRVDTNLESSSFVADHNVPPRNAPSDRQNEENSGSRPRFSSVEFDDGSGLSTVNANLSRIFGRQADGASNSGAHAPTSNPQIPDERMRRPSFGPLQTPEQASASSTMATIQVDAGITDMAAEPNSVGTSRPLRRRGRRESSLDVDGCALHAHKRRTLD